MLSAAAVASAPVAAYERRQPEQTVLYRTLQTHWRTFLADLESRGSNGLPRFVVDEVEKFLRCGILAWGCVRARRESCGKSRLVALSCKRRGYAQLRNMRSREAPRRATASDVAAVASRRDARDCAQSD